MSYTILGWSRDEWLIAKRWAQESGREYPPTFAGGNQLYCDWRAAHEPPPTPEELWFDAFRRAALR